MARFVPWLMHVCVCVCVEEPRRAKLESVTESRNQKRAFEAHSSAPPPVEQERKMSSVSFWPSVSPVAVGVSCSHWLLDRSGAQDRTHPTPQAAEASHGLG